jgi:hypothetical protein
MIKLILLGEYCHDCPYFEADVLSSVGFGSVTHIIKCAHECKCETVENYYKKETKNEFCR